MSDAQTRRIFGAAWGLFWLLLIAIGVQEYAREGGNAYWQPVLWESSSALVAGGLLLLQRRVMRRHDALLATPRRWFLWQFCWLPFNCTVFVLLVFGLRHGVYGLLGQEYHHSAWLPLFMYEAIKVSLLFAIFNVVMFGFLSWRQLLQEKERAQQAHLLLQQAQLQQLTQQMQPHFLFNALNTIASLIYTDPDQADATLIQLADFLRATLQLGGRQQVPLRTELHLLRAYAALMLARFGERVSMDWQVDDAVLDCAVPVMSLQPLLENIFKHTVEQHRQKTAITIRIQPSKDGGLQLQLADDLGRLPSTTRSGVGLNNLRQRLQVLYGDGASLQLTQLEPAGVLAELHLPWNTDADTDR